VGQTARPDALVLCSPLDYEAVLCRALGYDAMDRMGIVSLGYDTQCANAITIDYQPAVLGSIAVDQLISQLHRQERGIPRIQQTLTVETHGIGGSPLADNETRESQFADLSSTEECPLVH